MHNVARIDMGGRHVTNHLVDLLRKANKLPGGAGMPSTSAGAATWAEHSNSSSSTSSGKSNSSETRSCSVETMVNRKVAGAKEAFGYVAFDYDKELSNGSSVGDGVELDKTFELPDGTQVTECVANPKVSETNQNCTKVYGAPPLRNTTRSLHGNIAFFVLINGCLSSMQDILF